MNKSKNQTRSAVVGLASVGLWMLACGAGAQTISLLGTNPPTPGPDDQYQTNFVAMAQAVPPGGASGFNYYTDGNPAPGQTFTTGNNPDGYIWTSLSLYDADGTSGGYSSLSQTYTLRLYSVSGVSNATLLSTYGSQSIAIPDFRWFQWTDLGAVLQPNTTYAYSISRDASGWMNLGSYSNATYAGGEIVVIPPGGGTMTFSTSPNPWDAAFIVGLTPITVPVVGQPTFSPHPTVVPGASVTASAPVSGPGPYYFQWRTDGGGGGALTNLAGATSSNLVINTTGYAEGDYLYDLMVSNNTSVVTGAVAVLTIQEPIGIPGVIGIKFAFTNGYATSDAPWPADNTGVATGQLVPPSYQPLSEVGRWNTLRASITNGADSATRAAAINIPWTIDHDSAGNALTGVTLTPSGFNDGWYSGGTGCAAGRLLYDFWKFNGGNGQTTLPNGDWPAATLTVSGLPDGTYDVFVFINNNNGNYWGNAQANTVVAQGGTDIENTVNGFNGASADPCGLAEPLHTYSGYNGGNPANSVNYVKMSDVETSGGQILITVALFGGGDMGVSGIELVPVPENDLVLVEDTTPNFADLVVEDMVVFSGAFSDTPPVVLQWEKISGGMTNTVVSGVVTTTNLGIVDTTLTLTNVQTGDSGAYRIKATSGTNGAFYKFSSPAVLQVGNHPAPVNGVIVDYAAQAGADSFYPDWTVDTSTNNLVYGFPVDLSGTPGTILPGPGDFGYDGASGDPGVLTDGVLGVGKPVMVACGESIYPAGQWAAFTLLTNAAPYGFDISSVEIYGGWVDAGRRDQQYEVLYSTISDPTNFVSLISTYYLPDDPNGTAIATRTTLVPTGDHLAQNVAAIMVNWDLSPQHLNGWAMYAEVAVLGTPATGIPVHAPTLSAAVSNGNLVLSGTGGTAGSSYSLLETTNLAPPVIWVTNTTGLLDGAGSFSNSIPIEPTPPVRFFRVSVP